MLCLEEVEENNNSGPVTAEYLFLSEERHAAIDFVVCGDGMREDVTHRDYFRVQCCVELISAWVRVRFVFGHLYVQQSDPNLTAPASCQP